VRAIAQVSDVYRARLPPDPDAGDRLSPLGFGAGTASKRGTRRTDQQSTPREADSHAGILSWVRPSVGAGGLSLRRTPPSVTSRTRIEVSIRTCSGRLAHSRGRNLLAGAERVIVI
jgi:hypothetical protein